MLALILPLTLFAGAAAVPSGDMAPDRCEARSIPSLPAAEAGVAPIFFQYSEKPAAAGAQRLLLRVTVDDELLLTEELAILPDAAAQPIVELLSRDPENRARVRRLAADASKSVRVELTLPDGETRNESFADLSKASAALATGALRPQRTASVVKLTAQRQAPVSRIPCDDCYTNYDACIDGCGGGYQCEARCERILNRCLSTCSGGGCTPTSQTVVEQQVVGQSYLGYDCLQTPFEPSGSFHDAWQFSIKNTRKRITYNCDGTQTVEILEVWYTTQLCISAFGWGSCGNPTYWPGCTV